MIALEMELADGDTVQIRVGGIGNFAAAVRELNRDGYIVGTPIGLDKPVMYARHFINTMWEIDDE